ncbi:hypothetical protein PIB30_047259 [Stylosanthes scabra]|uniref:Uncharacterized protein n=1 Tax=Stylosanthes scabra TaxID=79078 RepID=A0ABU6QG24_9FABA|nr:hypothetical protein [Stylosanthes scabra]
MSDILALASPRQPGVPAEAVCPGDINRKNDEGWYIATALELPRILHVRWNSHIMASPEVLMPYFRNAGFVQADVNYHFGLCTHGDPVSGAMRDFETYYWRPTWGWVEQLLGARPGHNPKARKESFSLKMGFLLVLESFRMGGYVYGNTNSINVALRIFCEHLTEKMTSIPLISVDASRSEDSDLVVTRFDCLLQLGPHEPCGPGNEAARSGPADSR